MTTNALGRHRGPCLMFAVRPGKKNGQIRGEWLPGEVALDEVEDEATAILTDPRDAVLWVDIWSIKEGQFIHTIRPEKGSIPLAQA